MQMILRHYRSYDSYVDLDNFIDYYIAKMFFAVFDWPGNNIKFWKEQDENSRWRWLFLR